MVINNFKYRKNKNLANNVQRWRCTKNDCKIFLKLDQHNNILEKNETHINHDFIPSELLARQKISNTLKRKAIEDMSIRSSKLICQELRNDNSESLSVHDLKRIRQNISHAKTSHSQNLPKTFYQCHEAVEKINLKSNK